MKVYHHHQPTLVLETDSRESFLKGRISTVDLLALTNSDFCFETIFLFFTKQDLFMRSVENVDEM
jgi:hypothetical protein